MPFSSHSYSLHQIFSVEGWHKAQTFIEANDRVVFLQDAVYILQGKLTSNSTLLYARSLDTIARRINLASNPHQDVEAIDDELWVKLTEQSKNVFSW